MPFQPLKLRPGIRTDLTPLANESGLSSSQLIRFFHGILQKLGGWQRLISQAIIGTARSILFFEDFSGVQYIGIGSEQLLEIYSGGEIFDATPVQTTNNLTNPFSTILGTDIITVTDVTTSPQKNDWIYIVNNVAVGGLILQGLYQVQSIVDSTNYTIMSSSVATSTVSSGGTTAEFNTTNGNSTVQVTLDNNGYILGSIFTVYISTVVGGLTIVPDEYSVTNIIDADNFDIVPGGTATSTASAFENSGEIQIEYLLSSGNVSAINETGLYGAGPYGAGPYGIGQSNVTVQPRLWSLGAWGIDLAATYTNGPLYIWLSEDGLLNNRATVISQAPMNICAGIFIAMPQQQIVALGASDGTSSAPDFMLVRWCDIGDYTDWVASATNQAGSFRLPRGSKIVGGIQGPQQGLIWTDIGFWAMQYIGFPLVYGFNELGEGCGLIGQNARGVLGGLVYWMSYHGFFYYDGNSVQKLPCPVWDNVFNNLNIMQAQKIIAAPNSYFGEISFFYPSNTGDGEIDSYVKFNSVDDCWDYGSLARTAWMDQSSFLSPVGVDLGGLLQQHEVSNDADGTAMNSWAQTGWFDISSGTLYTFLERLIPDFIYQNGTGVLATIKLTLYFADYPNQIKQTIGPLTATQAIPYLIVRGRGRLVSIKIESADTGSFWRLGEILYSGSSSGRR